MSGLRAGGEGNAGNAGWRCLTCQTVFASSAAVRRHWEWHSEGHSVFRQIATGRLHHQTVEGLHERDWVPLGEPPRGQE